MAIFYFGHGKSWLEWLEENSFSLDIQNRVQKNGKLISYEISKQTQALVSAIDRIDENFTEVSDSLHDLSAGIHGLGVAFSYGFSLLAERLSEQSELLEGILARLESIDETLKKPIRTKALEYYSMGKGRLRNGLLDKALESFLNAEKIDDTDFLTQYSLGYLYLYGKNDDSDTIDLKKAETHLSLAIRYIKPELSILPNSKKLLGETYFHASVLYYVLGKQQNDSRNIESAKTLLMKASTMAKNAIDTSPQLYEGFFQYAKILSLLDKSEEAAINLKVCICADRNYCFRVDIDKDFDKMRSMVFRLFENLREETRNEAELALNKFPDITDLVGLNEQAKNALDFAFHQNEKATSKFKQNKYFDYLDVITISQEVINKFENESGIITKRAFEQLELKRRRENTKRREEEKEKNRIETLNTRHFIAFGASLIGILFFGKIGYEIFKNVEVGYIFGTIGGILVGILTYKFKKKRS